MKIVLACILLSGCYMPKPRFPNHEIVNVIGGKHVGAIFQIIKPELNKSCAEEIAYVGYLNETEVVDAICQEDLL